MEPSACKVNRSQVEIAKTECLFVQVGHSPSGLELGPNRVCNRGRSAVGTQLSAAERTSRVALGRGPQGSPWVAVRTIGRLGNRFPAVRRSLLAIRSRRPHADVVAPALDSWPLRHGVRGGKSC